MYRATELKSLLAEDMSRLHLRRALYVDAAKTHRPEWAYAYSDYLLARLTQRHLALCDIAEAVTAAELRACRTVEPPA